MSPTYTLMGTELSLFTGKANSYLTWRGVPFRQVIPSNEVYKNIILPNVHIAMIPILVVQDPAAPPDEQTLVIQDTKDIIDYFEARISLFENRFFDHPVIPRTPRHAFTAMLMELLADDWLVVQAMYWRWWEPHFKRQSHFLEFEFGNAAAGGNDSVQEMTLAGAKRLKRFSSFTPQLGVSEATSPAFEWQFRELLRRMSAHFDKYPFLMGRNVSIADFAFYGTFYAHLSRDPVPGFIIKTEAPLVAEWVERVKGLQRWAGGNTFAFEADRLGPAYSTYGQIKGEGDTARAEKAHDADDDLHDTTCGILQLLVRDFWPVLEDTVSRTLAYLDQKQREAGTQPTNSRIKLPRTLGDHDFTLHMTNEDNGRTVKGKRKIYTHSIWVLDRILLRTAHWPSQVAAAESVIARVGGDTLVRQWQRCIDAWKSSCWMIEREKNQLVARRTRRTGITSRM